MERRLGNAERVVFREQLPQVGEDAVGKLAARQNGSQLRAIASFLGVKIRSSEKIVSMTDSSYEDPIDSTTPCRRRLGFRFDQAGDVCSVAPGKQAFDFAKSCRRGGVYTSPARVTGAVLPPELVAAAKKEEIDYMMWKGVWDRFESLAELRQQV